VKALLLAVLVLSTGCAGSLESARLESIAGVRLHVPPASPERCQSLDDRHVAWGATAASAGLLASATGLVSIPADGDLQTGMVAGAVVSGAVAAGASYLSAESAVQWSRECAGQ
jgi:hypothetical protein